MGRTADNYAKALWELQIPLEAVREAEQLLKQEPFLYEALKSPAVSLAEKERVIDRIFPETVRSFFKTVCRHGRAGSLFEICDRLREYELCQRGILCAVLTYVTPPTEEQLQGISDFLKRRFQKEEVEFEMREDKSLLGGFILKAGAFEYDRSLIGRYRRLSDYLCGGEKV